MTLNLGLRYELPFAMTDPLDRKMAFAPGVQSTIAPTAPLGLLFPGDPGVGRGIIRTPRKNFAPRFGLAWDPFGDGKTSIRAAAGIFYGSISSNNMNMTTDYQPFSARQTFPNVKTLADPYGNMPGGSPFPITYDPKNPRFALLPADVSTVATNFHFPYTYQFNFSLQRQVRSDLSVSAAYVGSLAHRLPFTVDKNYAGYTPGATSPNLNSRRPYLPGTLGIIYYEDSHHQLRLSWTPDHRGKAHVPRFHHAGVLRLRQEPGRRPDPKQPAHWRGRGLPEPRPGARDAPTTTGATRS